jgi:hypothetical protein
MLTSVRVLMTRVIDYAGLFPPAQLGMPEAFGEYGRHRVGAHGWMLGRFVCPVGRLAELEPLLRQLQPDDDRVHLSVLGSGGETPEAFSRALERDVREIVRFVSSAGSQPVAVDQFEAPLPREAPPDALPGVVRGAVAALGDLTPVPPLPFFECSLLEGWRDRIKPSVEAISEASGDGRTIGLKIRCGGTTASAVPSVAAVAAAIAACRTAAVPLKATQGLHHPLRHFDVQLETTAHGFVNLFVGGALAQSIGVPEDRLLEVLEEEDPTAFAFTDETVTWRGHRLDIEGIAAGRRNAVTSFGSCSFDEPRDHLLELGLLDPQPTEPREAPLP